MDREMDQLTTLTVSLFGDPSSSLKIQVKLLENNTVSAESVLDKISAVIGLSARSRAYFMLVEGATCPVRRFKPSDVIQLPCPGLAVRKWVFTVAEENSLLNDSVAVELLLKHANHDVQNGKLEPQLDLAKDLEGCLSPEFPAEAQFVKLCQSLPGYETLRFSNCSLREDVKLPHTEIAKDSLLQVDISTKGLQYKTDHQKDTYNVSWMAVHSWSHCEESDALRFDLDLLGSRSQIHVTTPQSRFMLSALMEIIRILQNKKRANDSVIYFSSNVHRRDGWVTWDNLLYEPGLENPVFEFSPSEERKNFP